MIKALAITGPTASGKTAISIELAKRLDAEIISCDSMQIYKYMNIGTAKATEDEQREVRHHMIDFLSPTEDYSAESYRKEALLAAEEIVSRGKTPIFVGGTGLYIDTLMRAPMTDVPESSREYRDRIMADIKTEDDALELWRRLESVDPESAAAIHKNNLRRVIRALEIYDATGKTKSYFDRLSKEKSKDIDIGMITLDFHNRDNLYSRVDKRVDVMMSEGLLDEVRSLFEGGLLKENTTAAQAIGYKEIIQHLVGEITLDEAVALIKLSTRRYAKRQLTWFRHEAMAHRLYLDLDSGSMRVAREIFDEAYSFANGYMKEKI